MDDTIIKQEVQKYYADIAVSGQSCCASDSACCNPSDLITLTEDSLIADADLGLGCGLPTEYAGIKTGDTVLDLGSGAGVDVFRSANAVGQEGFVIGVDMTPEMIARARANAEKGGYNNVDFRLGEIENLPVDDASVDTVLSNCVINLVPDKKRVFDEIYRVLKTGGRMSVSDIVTTGTVPENIRKDMSMWAGCVAGAMDKDEYLKLVEDAGFSNIYVRQFVEYDPDRNKGFSYASMTFEAEKV